MKLVMFDLDGTLLSDMHNISQGNREAFRKLHQKGYRLGIASGRRVTNIEGILKQDVEYFDVLIGENGFQTKDLKIQESIYTDKLTVDQIKEIIETFEDDEGKVNFVYFGDEGSVFYKENDFSKKQQELFERVSKYLNGDNFPELSKLCMPVAPELANNYRIRVENIKGKPYHGVMTGTGFFEFMNVETSKWKALYKYLQKYGLTKDDVIAFGDSGNDMEILSNVGFAVAMQNADDKVKAICQAITEYPYNEDGVGKYIIDHML